MDEAAVEEDSKGIESGEGESVGEEKAIELWANHCFDSPQILRRSLSYELRSVFRCEVCRGILVGTKDSRLSRIVAGEGAGKESPTTEIEELQGLQTSGGVRAIYGCTACEGKRAYIGDGNGSLFIGGQTQSGSLDWKKSEFDFGAHRIQEIHVLSGFGGQFALLLTSEPKLFLLNFSSEPIRTQETALPRSMGWLIPHKDPQSDEGLDTRWHLLGFDGSILTLELVVEENVYRLPSELPQSHSTRALEEMPNFVAPDYARGRLRSFLYGTEEGLRALPFEEDGFVEEFPLYQGERVHFCKVLEVFGRRRLVMGSEAGRVQSRSWDHKDESDPDKDEPWLQWPVMPADVVDVTFVLKKSDRQEPSEALKGTAILILGTHKVVHLPFYNLEHIKGVLRGVDWGCVDWEKANDESLNTKRLAAIQITEPLDCPWSAKENHLDPDTRAKRLDPDIAQKRVERLLSLANSYEQSVLGEILCSIERTELQPPPRRAIELSARLLTNSALLDRQFVYQLAQRLLQWLLKLSRRFSGDPGVGFSSKELDLLTRWIRIVRKYFLEAATYSEKKLNIEYFIDVNKEHNNYLDALIYHARLCHRGYDMVEEIGLSSRVMDLDVLSSKDDSSSLVGISLEDGSFAGWRVQFSSGKFQQVEELRQDLFDSAGKRNHSRFLRLSDEGLGKIRWLAAPSSEGRGSGIYVDDEEEHCLSSSNFKVRVKPPDDSQKDIELRAYSIVPFDQGRYLMGLSDLDYPLALWSPAAGFEPSLIRCRWGIGRHVDSKAGQGVRRVWTIQPLPSKKGKEKVFAIGSQDGQMRVGRLLGDPMAMRFELERESSVFLGSSIRSSVYLPNQVKESERERTRRLLFVGTEGGDLYCFEYEPDTMQLFLKFRDFFLHRILEVLILTDDEGVPELWVLEDTGRLTCFGLGPTLGKIIENKLQFFQLRPGQSAEDYLGFRKGQLHVAEASSTAIALPGGLIAVACRVALENAQEESVYRLRLIKPRLEQKEGTLLLEESFPELPHAVETISPFAEGEENDLLAAFPLQSPALRAALVGLRLGEFPSRERLAAFAQAAANSYPEDRSELKRMLELIQMQLEQHKEDETKIRKFLHDLHYVFIGDRRFDKFLPPDPKREALIVKRLLSADLLSLWRLVAGEINLSKWINEHLQSPYKIVRQETNRALSEALFRLLRRCKEQSLEAIFPREEGRHPVAHISWLLDLIALFLYANPSSTRGAECDASTWGAVSIVVNLLRLFPDAALFIFDNLSVHRVNPMIFHILKRRLLSKQDEHIREKLDLYIPWTNRIPQIEEVLKHCEKIEKYFEALDLEGDEPGSDFLKSSSIDFHYFQAQFHCYRVIKQLAKANRIERLCELLGEEGEGANLHKFSVPKHHTPDWVSETWLTKRFFQYTEGWLSISVKSLLEGVCKRSNQANGSIKEAQEYLLQRLNTWEQEVKEGLPNQEKPLIPDKLFEPEISIGIAIFSHWKHWLEPRLPVTGDWYTTVKPSKSSAGKILYQLGQPLSTTSDWTFAVEIENGPELVMRIKQAHSQRERDTYIDLWGRIETLSQIKSNFIVPIEDIATKRYSVGMVMQRKGRDLNDSWELLMNCEDIDLIELSLLCCLQISRALHALHTGNSPIYHCDVRFSNILWVPGEAFYLTDFDLVANENELHPRGLRVARSDTTLDRTFSHAYSHLHKELRYIVERDSQVEGLDRVISNYETRALLQVIVRLLTRKRRVDFHKWSFKYVWLAEQFSLPDSLASWIKDLDRFWKIARNGGVLELLDLQTKAEGYLEILDSLKKSAASTGEGGFRYNAFIFKNQLDIAVQALVAELSNKLLAAKINIFPPQGSNAGLVLSQDEIHEIYNALNGLGFADRDRKSALISGISKEYVSGLPIQGSIPTDNLLTLLNHTNAHGRLPEGDVPMLIILKNAETLCSTRNEAKILRRYIEKIKTSPQDGKSEVVDLERALYDSKKVLVCIGPAGVGEIGAIPAVAQDAIKDKSIPVLLAGSDYDILKLPGYLEGLKHIDLRESLEESEYEKNLERLLSWLRD